MKRHNVIVLLAFFVVLIAGVAQAQENPVVLRLGSTYMIDTLNPANGFYGYAIRPLWYDTLVTWAGGDQFEPGLAESWSVSDDGLTWTFNIRRGVAFHDGTPLTAHEIAWNINWIIENEVPSMISYMTNVGSAEAVDDTTLLIHVPEPVPNMISGKLLYVWMLPPSVWENTSPDEITLADDLSVTIGSGPFRLTEYQQGEYLIMEANEGYWRGKPPVDQIIYQEFANDDALVQALLAGDIDFIITVPGTGVQALQDSGVVTVSIENTVYLEELIINSSPEGTHPESLNDPAVRLAIAHAIDKQTIATIGYLGYAELATTVIPTAMGQYHNSEIEDIPYDLAEASRILDEAGYVDSNGDGIREYSDGTPLEYRLYAPDSYTYYARIIELISQDLAEIGISAPAMLMSDDSLISLQVDYDSDLIYWGWFFDPDPGFALSIFTCAETVDGGWSDSGYCNEEYDALYQQQATAVDLDQRREIIWQMQQMLFDDRPYIPVVYMQSISAYRSDRFTFAPNVTVQPLNWALYDGFSVVGS